jgi:hypothetical protein
MKKNMFSSDAWGCLPRPPSYGSERPGSQRFVAKSQKTKLRCKPVFVPALNLKNINNP